MEKGALGHLRTQDDLHDLPIEMRTDVIAHKVVMLSLDLVCCAFILICLIVVLFRSYCIKKKVTIEKNVMSD